MYFILYILYISYINQHIKPKITSKDICEENKTQNKLLMPNAINQKTAYMEP